MYGIREVDKRSDRKQGVLDGGREDEKQPCREKVERTSGIGKYRSYSQSVAESDAEGRVRRG